MNDNATKDKPKNINTILCFDDNNSRFGEFAATLSKYAEVVRAVCLADVLKQLRSGAAKAVVAAQSESGIGELVLEVTAKDYPDVLRFYIYSHTTTERLTNIINNARISGVFTYPFNSEALVQSIVSQVNAISVGAIENDNIIALKSDLEKVTGRLRNIELELEKEKETSYKLDSTCVNCLVNNSFDFIALFNLNGQFTSGNANFKKTVLDVLRSTNPILMEYKIHFEQKIKEALKRNTRLVFDTMWYIDGRLTAASWTMKVHTDSIGKALYLSVQGRDISKIQSLKTEIAELYRRADESERLKNAFLTNISHEFRTPIHNILGFIDVLTTEDLGREDRALYSGIVKNNCNQLLKLLNDIVDISKIEAGVVELSQQEFEVNSMMLDMLALYHDVAIKKGLSLEFSQERDGMFFIKADELKLRQVLVNMLDNAFKYTSTGSISLGYKTHGLFIIFHVADTGIGISNDKSDVIFERFRQVDASYSRNYDGAGLGLAISKAFVELHGGRIWFDSEERKGTTFYCSVPIVAV